VTKYKITANKYKKKIKKMKIKIKKIIKIKNKNNATTLIQYISIYEIPIVSREFLKLMCRVLSPE